jgi:hypothetical protein
MGVACFVAVQVELHSHDPSFCENSSTQLVSLNRGNDGQCEPDFCGDAGTVEILEHS